MCKVFGIQRPKASYVLLGRGYTPIFDLFPLQPRRGSISVERSEIPISEPRRGDIYNFDKIFTHPSTQKYLTFGTRCDIIYGMFA